MSEDDGVREQLGPIGSRLFRAQLAEIDEEVHDTVVGMDQRRRTNAQRGSIDAGSFVLDLPARLPALWGTSTHPAWVEGEGLMLVGPQGVGKTTIAQQLVLALAGLRSQVLGMNVKPAEGKVLYLAMDRPLQIARSWSRMVTEDEREQLSEHATVWRGPLPFSLVNAPRHLAAWARDKHEAAVVVVDSYKDLAPDLSSETTGAQINEAVQECLAEGIQWVGLHHHRKGTAENPAPKTLQDVYGSGWLTAGLGSVLGLGGDPGAELVEVKHLKQPAETLGTFGVKHDHAKGTSERADELPEPTVSPSAKGTDKRRTKLVEALRSEPEKAWTASGLAAAVGSSPPTVRNDMAALVAAGDAERTDVESNTFRWKAAT